jgi:4-diphosphocytidyl-2-C-methyl-D-erythritol kinase
MKTLAPAKINWTLEVLGRREDGYHEIRSVMQTIDLCDELLAERSDETSFETTTGKRLKDDDLMVRAARALEIRVGRALAAQIRIEKRIPLASGLGGGSSDAAATLRLLNCLHGIGLSNEELASVGAEIGSDVPFFVYGGTALVEGRGERVSALRDVEGAWLIIVVPEVQIAEKTSRMYARLTATDYTGGIATDNVAYAVSNGVGISDLDLFNVFDPHAFDFVKELEELKDGLFLEGLSPVHVVGSGPAVFAYCGSQAGAESRAEELAAYAEASSAGESGIFVVRSLGGSLATAVFNGRSGSAG